MVPRARRSAPTAEVSYFFLGLRRIWCGQRRLVKSNLFAVRQKKRDDLGLPLSLMRAVSLGGGYFDVDVPLLDADGLA